MQWSRLVSGHRQHRGCGDDKSLKWPGTPWFWEPQRLNWSVRSPCLSSTSMLLLVNSDGLAVVLGWCSLYCIGIYRTIQQELGPFPTSRHQMKFNPRTEYHQPVKGVWGTHQETWRCGKQRPLLCWFCYRVVQSCFMQVGCVEEPLFGQRVHGSRVCGGRSQATGALGWNAWVQDDWEQPDLVDVDIKSSGDWYELVLWAVTWCQIPVTALVWDLLQDLFCLELLCKPHRRHL